MPIIGIQELIASAGPSQTWSMELFTAAIAGCFALCSNGLNRSRREIVQVAESVRNNFRWRREEL